jgi:hypothetical protein
MTLNRLLTTAVQIFLALPIIWYVREIIKEKRKS